MDYFSQRAAGAAFIGLGTVYTATSSNFAFKKEILLENREEFSMLGVSPAEDNYLLQKTFKKYSNSIAVATQPESYITTTGAVNLMHFFSQRFRWAAYNSSILNFSVSAFFIPMILFYCILLVYTGIFLSGNGSFNVFIVSIFSKLLVDYIFMIKATTIFNCRYLLNYFIPLSIIHLFLLPVIVFKGNLFSSRIKWKN